MMVIGSALTGKGEQIMPDREKVSEYVKNAFDIWIDEYEGTSYFNIDEIKQVKKDALELLKEQNQDEKMYTASEVCLALIDHGQSDERFEWGEVIKYSPSEVEKILKGEM